MKMFKLRSCLPLLVSVLFFSCAAPQKTIYFNNSNALDSTISSITSAPERETVVQPDDILAINITSISSISGKDPVSIFKEGGTLYNVTANSGSYNTAGAANAGYLVDKEGYIDFPAVGKIKIAGLSMRQAKDAIAQELKLYIKEPVVEVRIVNFKITVLGEVGSQGTILAPNHKINIVEAVAAAGGIPPTGRKENVMIIRENNGHRDFMHVNLNSREVFKSPYYYLKQNDIVYVEPSRIRRQESNEFLRLYLPIITTLLSTAITVYGLISISNNNK